MVPVHIINQQPAVDSKHKCVHHICIKPIIGDAAKTITIKNMERAKSQ